MNWIRDWLKPRKPPVPNIGRTIRKIVIHVADTPDSKYFDADDINQWHIDRGWSGIGYHYVVNRGGEIELGRPMDQIGAHVKGHNKDSIGIVWVGRDIPEFEQYLALIRLTYRLMKQFRLKPIDVYGHKELASGKTCPNLDMEKFRQYLREKNICLTQ